MSFPDLPAMLDELRLPDGRMGASFDQLNHGRSIVRTADGRWIVVGSADRHQLAQWRRLKLWTAPASADRGEQFTPPVALLDFRPQHSFTPVLSEESFLGSAALHIDAGDRLTLFYDTDQGVRSRSIALQPGDLTPQLTQAGNWSAPRSWTAPGARLAEVIGNPAGALELFYTDDAGLWWRSSDGEPQHLAPHALHPSAFVDRAGVTHVAFEQHRLLYYLRRAADASTFTNRAGQPKPELVAQFCSSFPSLAVTDTGQVVIAYQGEGKAVLKDYPQLYAQMRAAGGSTISYAVLTDAGWRRTDLLRSSEVLLKRRPHHRKPQKDPRFIAHLEELWRPSLSVDRHGVVWMFWSNTTRRHVYFSRFLGESFTAPLEAVGPLDALERPVLVQKDATRHERLGVLTVGLGGWHFDSLPVPTLEQPARRVVFLDQLELIESRGLTQQVGQLRKHPQPLFGHGLPGPRPTENPCWLEAFREGEAFAMHLMYVDGVDRCCSLPARLHSDDGLTWREGARADDRDWTLDGAPFPNGFWRPIFLRDDAEPDAQQRYKGLLGDYRYAGEVELRYHSVVVSPDGKHWRRVPNLQPVCCGDISVPSHLLRDDDDPDPTRRYKFLCVPGSMAGRGVALFTSPDLLHWNAPRWLREDPNDPLSPWCPFPTGPLPLDPDGGENPWEEELHDAAIWRENRLLMFHYDAFYLGANQHTQKALAVSRDGRHFWRVQRGAINLPNGAAGDFDSGRVRTVPPVRVGDELWFYYCGMPASYFDNPDEPGYKPALFANAWGQEVAGLRQLQRPWKVGLAKLRADGWAYLQMQREVEEASATTITLKPAGGRLVVNGIGLGTAGLSVAVLDAVTRQPLPGYGFDECQCSAADGVNVPVRWGARAALPTGAVRLAFRFRDLRAKLFAFEVVG